MCYQRQHRPLTARRAWPILALLLAGSSGVCAPPPPSGPSAGPSDKELFLSIAATKIEYEVNDPVFIKAVLTNAGPRDFALLDRHVLTHWELSVTGADGTKIPATLWGKSPPPPVGLGGRSTGPPPMAHLKSKEQWEREIPLSRAFDLSLPGKYHVSGERYFQPLSLYRLLPHRAWDVLPCNAIEFSVRDGVGGSSWTIQALSGAADQPMVWGRPSRGVAVGLGTEKTNYLCGEKVLLTLAIKNEGAEPVTLPIPGSAEGLTNRAVRWDGRVVPAPYTLYGTRLTTAEARPKPTPAELRPGQMAWAKLPLSRIFDMTEDNIFRISWDCSLAVVGKEGAPLRLQCREVEIRHNQ
jgi:hypothetical protein